MGKAASSDGRADIRRCGRPRLAVFGHGHPGWRRNDRCPKTARRARQSLPHARRMDLDHDACYRAISQRDARFDGRLFIGVKTTGVYCRPVCPARTPRSQNVNFYPTAAAAQEAGFRPCLRCRPETAPDMGAWRGTSNTVSRALAPDRAWRARRRRCRCSGQSAGRRRAATAASFSPASWRFASRRRADPPRAARQAIDPRDAPADDRDRFRRRLRQRAPVQRDLPGLVRPRARRFAAAQRAGDFGWRARRGQPAAALSTAL